MKTTTKILTSLLSLPLLFSAASVFAETELFAKTDKPNKHHWIAMSNTKAKVLASDVKKSKGLVTKCYPDENKIDVEVRDLTAFRGAVVRYWTYSKQGYESNQGTFVPRSDGIVSSAGNDDEIVNKFISDIAHDYSIKFKFRDQEATYSLLGSADTLRSLEGCGLPQRKG